jgi:hypothetical protein
VFVIAYAERWRPQQPPALNELLEKIVKLKKRHRQPALDPLRRSWSAAPPQPP